MTSAVFPPHVSGFPVTDNIARVVSNDLIIAEYWRLVLAVDEPATRAAPGQFFQMRCPAHDLNVPYLRRPMSVYRADCTHGLVEFLYKVTGAGTRGLSSLAIGAPVSILGPLGHGFHVDPSWKHVVAVGRGVGLATLAPLAELAARQQIGLTAILSARSEAHVISVRRFIEAGANVVTVVDTDGSSDPVHVEALVRTLIADNRADAFFTCGSNRLLLLLQRVALEHSIPGQVAVEQRMACGLGMCFSCVRAVKSAGGRASKRVCWDGPVFDLQEIFGW
jgi:dihydroorotate dehydrogenase electron transfer subunit